MVSYTLLLLLLFAGLPCVQGYKVGLLLPSKPVVPGFPSAETSGGAVTLALREAKARFNQNITVLWNDSKCDEGISLIKAYDLGETRNVSVIIGPACQKAMDFVTKLMTVLEGGPVPTVTWLPRQQNQNDTAISTYWTFDAITNAFVLTLKKFAWKNIGILYSDEGLCPLLLSSMNILFPNKDLEITRNLPLKTMDDSEIQDKLELVRSHARVIILCMPSESLFHFLTLADGLGMTAREYVYIYCRFGPAPGANLGGPPGMNKDDRDRILSPLLQVGMMNMDQVEYSQFLSDVKSNVTDFPNCCDKTDEFSIALYKTILAVSQVLFDPGSNLTLQDLRVPSANSDLAKLLSPISLYHQQGGVFERVGTLTTSYNHVRDIIWPTGNLPPDPPECGWDGQQCTNEVKGTDNAVIIGSCVSIVVLVIAAVFLYIYYRKSQQEKELISMIWKVQDKDIKLRRPRGATQSSLPDHTRNAAQTPPPAKRKFTRGDTRGTLGLGSTSSIDKTVLFAQVGCYKGSVVTVKNIQRRSIPLTREMLRDLKTGLVYKSEKELFGGAMMAVLNVGRSTLRELQHENLNPFIGISLEPDNNFILTKYCSKGSLQDVLENDDIKLDNMFQMSFLMDLTRGLDFLHKSPVKSHGNLKSTNCVMDSRWVLKLTDFGAIVAQIGEEPQDVNDEQGYYSKLLWTAPELLRLQKRPPKGTQKGDVFSFAIIMQEILLRCPPYDYNNAQSDKYIINHLRSLEDPPYRPKIPETTNITDRMRNLMAVCWHRNSELRPDAHTILKTLIDISGRRKINIMDNMIKMLEAYSNNLEELVAERTEELAQEKQKTDRLLYQMLPPSVAEQLKRGEHVVPETFSKSSLFFSDIVGFTSISGDSNPLQVIDLLNDLYTTFDEIIGWHDVYKVETIGDAYMVASGIPRRNGKRHSGEIAKMALDLLSAVTHFRIRHMPGAKLQLRIGLHTGPCAAGVVGLTMPRYCLFGDTINMASRMESTGKAFHIHVSNDLADALKELNWGFQLVERGIIEVKGKGLQKTYWLIGKDGYKNTLPEEIQRLARKVEEAKENGRPLSPTDTHISTGSHQESESTSMYGNIFRRASFAVRFIRKLSHNSRDNSPNGSKLSVRDGISNTGEEQYAGKTLHIPGMANGLKPNALDSTQNLNTNEGEACSVDNSDHVKKKKKKKKKKSKKSKLAQENDAAEHSYRRDGGFVENSHIRDDGGGENSHNRDSVGSVHSHKRDDDVGENANTRDGDNKVANLPMNIPVIEITHGSL